MYSDVSSWQHRPRQCSRLRHPSRCALDCRHGGTYKALCNCLKYKLVHHDASKYDGYRLTNLGYDFLAINTLSKRGLITSVGRQIGVGKESDLFEARLSTFPARPLACRAVDAAVRSHTS